MKNKSYGYFICLIITIVIACFVASKSFPKEMYGVYIGYPKGYISEFNNAHSLLLNEKDEIITRFGGRNATAGQLGRGVQNSSNELTEIPSKIEVMWISFAENQFWHGEFDLPKEELKQLLNKEKLLDLFSTRQGIRHDKYNKIIVNVAPKGKVHIYVSGFAVKHVATYQAKAIDYDWEQHARDTWWLTANSTIEPRDEYVKAVVDDDIELISNLNNYYNEDFFRPVSWTLSMKGEEELLAYATKSINGEYVHVLLDPTKEVMRSLPKEIAFDFVHDKKARRVNLVFHNPYAFFKEHFDFRSKFKIIMEMPTPQELVVYFQQGEKIVEFKDIEAEELDR